MAKRFEHGIPVHFVVDKLGIIMRLRNSKNEELRLAVILNECSEVKNLSQQILVHCIVGASHLRMTGQVSYYNKRFIALTILQGGYNGKSVNYRLRGRGERYHS